MGRLHPDPYYPFINPFWQKKYPFSISIGKWYPFHIPSLHLCTAFNCCKCTVLSIWIHHKTTLFYRLFHSHNVPLSPFGTFYKPKWQISLLFHMLQIVNSLPFHIPGAWKRYPFGRCLPVQAIYGWYPPEFHDEISTMCTSLNSGGTFLNTVDLSLIWHFRHI